MLPAVLLLRPGSTCGRFDGGPGGGGGHTDHADVLVLEEDGVVGLEWLGVEGRRGRWGAYRHGDGVWMMGRVAVGWV